MIERAKSKGDGAEMPGNKAHPSASQDASEATEAMAAPNAAYPRQTPSAYPRLRPGEVVASRFEVVRFIGRGGMGEVYEVQDRHLHAVHIALKTLLPHIAGDLFVQQSFEREVLLARSLTHPNVCPIYDIFHCEDGGQPLLFLTMKLISGETLSRRLEKTEELSLDEADVMIRQIAAGLCAAHAAGIVHRDIKTGNILLENEGMNVHVWITDFGLARLYQGETTIFSAPVVVGTPGYIAPEIYEGRAATVSSDVFAFGVVARKILDAVPEPLPAKWEEFLAGCLEADPAKRYKSVEEAIATLDGSGYRTLLPRRISRRRMLALSGAAVAGVASGIWFGVEKFYPAKLPLPDVRFVALLAWPRVANEDAAIVASLLDSIGNRLVRAEAYVKNLLIISSPDINVAPTYTAASPASLVTSLGANLALAASLSHNNFLTTLKLQVLEAETSRVLRRDHASVSPREIDTLADKAANMAARMLELPKDISLKDPDELQRVSARTYKLFSEAEELAAQPNETGLDAAIAKYQEALNEDPHFALGYAQLSLSYTRQFLLHHERGALHLAQSNADLALQYNPHSARGILSKARCLLYSGNTDQALGYLNKALNTDPKNPETLLFKAQAFEFLNRWKDAEQMYKQILTYRPNYWPAHNELGWVLFRQAEYKKAADAFDNAHTVAPKVALPLANLGTMYMEMGKTKDAIDALKRSIDCSPNEIAYLGLGDIAFSSGDYKTALVNYGKAKDISPKNDLAWRNLGDTYSMLDDPAKMMECYRNAANILTEKLSINPSNGVDWMTLAFYHAKLGDSSSAWEDLKQADAHGAADVESQFTKAQALALLGKKEEALKLVIACMAKGLNPLEVRLALDLKDVRLDPRYKLAEAKLRSQDPT